MLVDDHRCDELLPGHAGVQQVGHHLTESVNERGGMNEV